MVPAHPAVGLREVEHRPLVLRVTGEVLVQQADVAVALVALAAAIAPVDHEQAGQSLDTLDRQELVRDAYVARRGVATHEARVPVLLSPVALHDLVRGPTQRVRVHLAVDLHVGVEEQRVVPAGHLPRRGERLVPGLREVLEREADDLARLRVGREEPLDLLHRVVGRPGVGDHPGADERERPVEAALDDGAFIADNHVQTDPHLTAEDAVVVVGLVPVEALPGVLHLGPYVDLPGEPTAVRHAVRELGPVVLYQSLDGSAVGEQEPTAEPPVHRVAGLVGALAGPAARREYARRWRREVTEPGEEARGVLDDLHDAEVDPREVGRLLVQLRRPRRAGRSWR